MSAHTSNNRLSQSVTAIVPRPRQVSSSPVLSDLLSRQALKTTPIVPYPTTLALTFDTSIFGTSQCHSSFINPPTPSPTRKSYLGASQIAANLQKLVGQSSQKHPSSPSSTFTSSEMSLSGGSLGTCPLSIEQVHWCMDCCYKEIQSRCKSGCFVTYFRLLCICFC